ncbi:MAG: 16S rRNA (uracil(1498)-N(3))-methyltransferase [Acholeplasma sp.]|jgi:16S rRNA (uracil1498-N3)-methyltransferase|nr:MAG: 16S rRNA (uracil(1498)-N(3))-methyltransferase [Acholeplasma sp.]
MQRYFLSQKSNQITGQDAHHILKVMRMKSQDEVIVCYDHRCFLSSLIIHDSDVFFEEIKELERMNTPKITLIQGLPKHPKSELVVKYATLFGATSILFVPMMRSIAKLDNEANKQKRLEMIAKEASELAHRFDVPEIILESSFKKIHWKDFDTILLADENEKTSTLDQVLPLVSSQMKIALVIGPEGGITDQEREYLSSVHALSVSLGKYILPTELAALYALSYLSIKNT